MCGFAPQPALPPAILHAMAYYLQMLSSDGRMVRDDEPYADIADARRDAEFGARQIVGDAIRGGISRRAETYGRTFEIVDEAGIVTASLSFWDMIDAG